MLAQRLYRPGEQRSYIDIDVLVDPDARRSRARRCSRSSATTSAESTSRGSRTSPEFSTPSRGPVRSAAAWICTGGCRGCGSPPAEAWALLYPGRDGIVVAGPLRSSALGPRRPRAACRDARRAERARGRQGDGRPRPRPRALAAGALAGCRAARLESCRRPLTLRCRASAPACRGGASRGARAAAERRPELGDPPSCGPPARDVSRSRSRRRAGMAKAGGDRARSLCRGPPGSPRRCRGRAGAGRRSPRPTRCIWQGRRCGRCAPGASIAPHGAQGARATASDQGLRRCRRRRDSRCS